MNVTQQGDGRLLNNILYVGEGDHGKINLRTTKGSLVKYGKNTLHEIDFPGEYDISGITVRCIEADSTLHYVITTDNEKIALIQKAAALEVANFDAIDTWICVDKDIKEEIERLEMEGNIMVLGEKEPQATQG